jgi:hypothetical protein
VIAVQMGNEDFADLAEIVSGLHNAFGDLAAGIDQIKRAVDDQKIGRLRALGLRQRAARGAERDQRCLRGCVICERH